MRPTPIALRVELPVEAAQLRIDGSTQVPVLPDFGAVGGAAAGRVVPMLAWARLYQKEGAGAAIWAGLAWSSAGLRYLTQVPAEGELVLAAATQGTLDGRGHRVLMLVPQLRP